MILNAEFAWLILIAAVVLWGCNAIKPLKAPPLSPRLALSLLEHHHHHTTKPLSLLPPPLTSLNTYKSPTTSWVFSTCFMRSKFVNLGSRFSFLTRRTPNIFHNINRKQVYVKNKCWAATESHNFPFYGPFVPWKILDFHRKPELETSI